MGRILHTLCLLSLSGILLGQSKSEIRDIFVEAESHFLYSEYEDAILLFLLLEDENNANIQYKIGVCYLNIPNEKDKAIPFLENAVRNTAYDAKDDQYTETRAPLDAYFYLGNAYRITNQLDKAIVTYNHFKTLVQENSPMENDEFITQEIRACEIAKELEKTPVDFTPENLGDQVNVVSINKFPAVSGDESTLVFTAKYGEEDVLFASYKERGVWGQAEDISDMLLSGRDASSCALSYDGKTLFLYKSDEMDGNLYFSENQSGVWSPIQKLNRNINTKYFESHASLSRDGNSLYFTSNRPGGHGELDIYVSRRENGEGWGPAQNLGDIINTPFNEDHPFISENDSLLYFCSEGHYNMGGYDVFYSKRNADGSWTKPVSLGYPLNSTDDDLFFNPVQNGAAGYMSMLVGYKEFGLYKIYFSGLAEVPEKRKEFTIRGIVHLKDPEQLFNQGFQISLIDQASNEVTDVGFPNENTGQYSFITKSGEYSIEFTGPGYETHTESLIIDEFSKENEYIIDVDLIVSDKPVQVEPQKWLKDTVSIQDAKPLDASIVLTDLSIEDVGAADEEREVLFYTIQLMALKQRPVDISYFAPLEDVLVVLGNDGFYRYTFGRFGSLEEADEMKTQLVNMGYSQDLWVKKVFRETE